MASRLRAAGQVFTSSVYLPSGPRRLFPLRRVHCLIPLVPTGSVVTVTSVTPESRLSIWAFLLHSGHECFPARRTLLPEVSPSTQGSKETSHGVSLAVFPPPPASPPAFLPHLHIQPISSTSRVCLGPLHSSDPCRVHNGPATPLPPLPPGLAPTLREPASPDPTDPIHSSGVLTSRRRWSSFSSSCLRPQASFLHQLPLSIL